MGSYSRISQIAKNAEREQKDEFAKIVKAELKLADGSIDKVPESRDQQL